MPVQTVAALVNDSKASVTSALTAIGQIQGDYLAGLQSIKLDNTNLVTTTQRHRKLKQLITTFSVMLKYKKLSN